MDLLVALLAFGYAAMMGAFIALAFVKYKVDAAERDVEAALALCRELAETPPWACRCGTLSAPGAPGTRTLGEMRPPDYGEQ